MFDRGLFLGGGLFLGLLLLFLDGFASSGDEDCAAFLGEDGQRVGWWWLGLAGRLPVEEALEFGGEAEAGEFVGHPDVGVAVVGVFDPGAEVAGWGDVTGRRADDAGEEIVDFAQVQGDAGGAGLLECFDAGDDVFPAQETASARRSYTSVRVAVFRTVNVQIRLSGVSARSDFTGEGFVTWVG
jgi:hypothetical protein